MKRCYSVRPRRCYSSRPLERLPHRRRRCRRRQPGWSGPSNGSGPSLLPASIYVVSSYNRDALPVVPPPSSLPLCPVLTLLGPVRKQTWVRGQPHGPGPSPTRLGRTTPLSLSLFLPPHTHTHTHTHTHLQYLPSLGLCLDVRGYRSRRFHVQSL